MGPAPGSWPERHAAGPTRSVPIKAARQLTDFPNTHSEGVSCLIFALSGDLNGSATTALLWLMRRIGTGVTGMGGLPVEPQVSSCLIPEGLSVPVFRPPAAVPWASGRRRGMPEA